MENVSGFQSDTPTRGRKGEREETPQTFFSSLTSEFLLFTMQTVKFRKRRYHISKLVKLGIMVIPAADQEDELAHFPGRSVSCANFVEDNLVIWI